MGSKPVVGLKLFLEDVPFLGTSVQRKKLIA
jgi:hypothetical protein